MSHFFLHTFSNHSPLQRSQANGLECHSVPLSMRDLSYPPSTQPGQRPGMSLLRLWRVEMISKSFNAARPTAWNVTHLDHVGDRRLMPSTQPGQRPGMSHRWKAWREPFVILQRSQANGLECHNKLAQQYRQMQIPSTQPGQRPGMSRAATITIEVSLTAFNAARPTAWNVTEKAEVAHTGSVPSTQPGQRPGMSHVGPEPGRDPHGPSTQPGQRPGMSRYSGFPQPSASRSFNAARPTAWNVTLNLTSMLLSLAPSTQPGQRPGMSPGRAAAIFRAAASFNAARPTAWNVTSILHILRGP